MIRCLVSENETETGCSSYLTQEKEIELVKANSEEEIIECFKVYLPDIIVIDIDHEKYNAFSVINKITHFLLDSCTSNIIVLYSDFSKLENLTMSKVFACIKKPVTRDSILNSLFRENNEKSETKFLNDILHQKIYLLLRTMRFPISPVRSLYLRKAVRDCYREPKKGKNLTNIYETIATRNNTSAQKIEWDITSVIRQYRQNYDKNKTTLKGLFGDNFCEEELTPKHLIYHMSSYLRIENNKKNF